MNGGSRLLPILLVALFLAALGVGLASFTGPSAYLPRLLLLGAAVCMMVFIYRGRREILFLLLKARRVAEPGPASTWFLSAAVFFLASMVASRIPLRVDATSRGLNALTGASRQVLDAGSNPIELIGVYRETNPQRARAKDMLEIYRVASRRVRVRMLDPDRQPDQARSLGLTRSSLVVVRSGAIKEEVDGLDEQAITQGILRVENPRRSRLIFITGHGERSFNDGGLAGLGKLAAALRQAGYDLDELKLYEEEMPADAAAAALVAPSRRLLPIEIDRLARFIDNGGRALICLEPGTHCGLEEFLLARGIVLDSLEVYDDSPSTRGLALGPRIVAVTDYASHPIITAGIGNSVFPGVRTVSLSKQAQWGIDAKNLFRTGPHALLVDPKAPAPEPGSGEASRPLAVVQEWEVPAGAAGPDDRIAREKPYGRLLVVGDADWLSGQSLDLFSNRDLALRSLHWLAQREFLLQIPPVDTRGTPLTISLAGIRTLLYLLQIALPLLLLGIGLRLWTRRR